MVPGSIEELKRLWRSDDWRPREELIIGIAEGPSLLSDVDFSDSDELIVNLASFLTIEEAVSFFRDLERRAWRVDRAELREAFLDYFPACRAPLRVDDFLNEADGWIDEGWYPNLGHDDCFRWCAVGIRMHAFASQVGWALVFERNVWCWATTSYLTDLAVFLSDGDESYLQRSNKPFHFPIGNDQRLWSDAGFTLDPFSFELPINGIPRKFSFTPEDYKRINAELMPEDQDRKYDDVDNLAVKTLRLLDVMLGDEIYLKPDEIATLRLADQPDLRHMLTLADFYLPPPGKLPSESKTFRMLGEVLVHQDPSRYRAADAELTNTRWSDWPFAGTE